MMCLASPDGKQQDAILLATPGFPQKPPRTPPAALGCFILQILLLPAWLVGKPAPADAATPAAPRSSALILHDASGPSGWLGGMHARLLGNLLGHFDLNVHIQPVESYQSGDASTHAAVFYFGTVFNNPLPTSFLHDLPNLPQPICWFKYNLWQWIDSAPDQFTARFGFRFDHIEPSGFTEVIYKDEQFTKDSRDPDLGRTTVLNPALAQARAWAWNSAHTADIPYILQSGRFWYVADSPFSYISEEDRYLVLADLLHDMLESDHPEYHPALIRLEDITPDYPTPLLQAAADLLHQEDVPFSIAIVPVFEDPLGRFNQGIPQRLPMTERPSFVQTLQSMLRQGAQILLHGYTHQYQNIPNPFSAVSGDDYEFFRVTLDPNQQILDFQPVPEDSPAWVQMRLDAAQTQLAQTGFSAVAWVTPHYTASALDYRVFATNSPCSVERVTYFDESGHVSSQFFPYPIERDIYGQKVLPENLGSIMPGPDPSSPGRSSADLVRFARKNRVVRDGWASAFFHPFLDPTELRELVRGLRALGYSFRPVTTNEPPSVCDQSPDQHHWPGSTFPIHVVACGSAPIRFQWQHNQADLPGATNDTLLVTNLQPARLGTYTARATNIFGHTTSYPIQVRFLVTPVIHHFAITNQTFQICFNTAEGLRYYVEYQDFLGAASWTATFPVVGCGNLTNINAPLGTLPQRFYRLRAE